MGGRFASEYAMIIISTTKRNNELEINTIFNRASSLFTIANSTYNKKYISQISFQGISEG
jgi:hypothetical protein